MVCIEICEQILVSVLCYGALCIFLLYFMLVLSMTWFCFGFALLTITCYCSIGTSTKCNYARLCKQCVNMIILMIVGMSTASHVLIKNNYIYYYIISDIKEQLSIGYLELSDDLPQRLPVS